MGAHVTASNTPLGGDLKELQECVEQWKCEEGEGKVPAGFLAVRCACTSAVCCCLQSESFRHVRIFSASTDIRKALDRAHFGEAGAREPGGSIRVVELTWGEEVHPFLIVGCVGDLHQP